MSLSLSSFPHYSTLPGVSGSLKIGDNCSIFEALLSFVHTRYCLPSCYLKILSYIFQQFYLVSLMTLLIPIRAYWSTHNIFASFSLETWHKINNITISINGPQSISLVSQYYRPTKQLILAIRLSLQLNIVAKTVFWSCFLNLCKCSLWSLYFVKWSIDRIPQFLCTVNWWLGPPVGWILALSYSTTH